MEVQYIRNKFLTKLVWFTALLPLSIFLIWWFIPEYIGILTEKNLLTQYNLYISLIFSILFAVIILLLFKSTNLAIEVRPNGLYYKYFPFHIKVHSIATNDILSWGIKKIRPLLDYGGWGIRYGFGKKEKSYIADDKEAVLFVLKNKKKILFSCCDSTKMHSALSELFKFRNNEVIYDIK